MPIYLSEMENEGLILVGRPLQTEFESAAAIKACAEAVDALGKAHGIALSFVYAGTTINWPEGFEFTACLIGVVTHVDYGDDDYGDGVSNPLPREALAPVTIPQAIWDTIERELGVQFEGETSTYLAVAGWTWTHILGADGERIIGVAAEDNGYVKIDDEARVMTGDEPLTMQTSYC